MRTSEKKTAAQARSTSHASPSSPPLAKRDTRSDLRVIALEAMVASAAAVMLSALLSSKQLGLGTLVPHPVWLAAIALAARYGGRGLAIGAPMAWGGLLVAGLVVHVGPRTVLERLSTGPDLCAFAAAVIVSSIASMHERRHGEAARKLAALEKRCASDHEALVALRQAAVVLRARADRLDTSLTFLRDVAGRLASDDAEVAAQAALDLATARLGARAAVLHTVSPAGGVAPLVSTGVWAPSGGPGSQGVSGDRTTAAVLRTSRPVRAVDLPEGGPDDSDLAAPVVDERGALVGILAVRGVPMGGASAAGLRELAIIAAWPARSIARFHGARDGVPEVAAAALGPEAAATDGGALPALPPLPPAALDDTDAADASLDPPLAAPARSISQVQA